MILDWLQFWLDLTDSRVYSPTLARFHFRSIIDGESRPLARHSAISIQLDNIHVENFQLKNPNLESEEFISDPDINIQTEVMGTLFIVGCRWLDIEGHIYELLLFGWISGVLLGRIRSDTTIVATFALLDKKHLALYSAICEDQSYHPDVVVVLVYQIPSVAHPGGDANGHFETASYATLAPIMVLEFPRIQYSLIFENGITTHRRTNPCVDSFEDGEVFEQSAEVLEEEERLRGEENDPDAHADLADTSDDEWDDIEAESQPTPMGSYAQPSQILSHEALNCVQKVHCIVVDITSSPARRKRMRTITRALGLELRAVIKSVKVRWNSILAEIRRAILLKPAINQYVATLDEGKSGVALRKARALKKKLTIGDEEWDALIELVQILRVC
ncbi:hypothetical protein RSAG8_09422, partial [Rhizoctonia solani AG-8 WAC10335]